MQGRSAAFGGDPDLDLHVGFDQPGDDHGGGGADIGKHLCQHGKDRGDMGAVVTI